MSKYAFLGSSVALIIYGSLLGLAGGFKIANLQYHSEQSGTLNRNIDKATKGASGAQAEVTAILEKAKANPNDADAQIEAAAQFLQIERPQEAMPFLEQAKNVKPNDPRVSAGFGVAYFMMEQYDQAIDSLNRSREQGADSPVVSSFLIGAYIQTRKNLDEADKLLKELETNGGVDPVRLGQIRADLNAAKTGGIPNQGAAQVEKNGEAQKPRTTLSHGPEQPKIVK
jgi:tetratricopeptide (TPR) repeat protein